MSGQPDNAAEVVRRRGHPPLYAQVAEQIVGGVRAAGLAPGDRVPSEPQLMREYGVSRATARMALEHLVRAGVVRREQGRGTFLESPRLLQRRPRLASFSESVSRSGHRPTHRLLAFEPLDPHAAEPLRAWFPGDAELVRIVRLRLVDEEPVGLHRVVVTGDDIRRARIDEPVFGDPHASLYGLLEAGGIHIAEGEEHLQAVAAGPAEADVLQVARGAALMRVLRVSWDASGRPVEATDARYVADRFDYSVALTRSGMPGGEARNEKEEIDHGEEAHRRGGSVRAARGRGGRVREVG